MVYCRDGPVPVDLPLKSFYLRFSYTLMRDDQQTRLKVEWWFLKSMKNIRKASNIDNKNFYSNNPWFKTHGLHIQDDKITKHILAVHLL